jgi:hypothetical protein
MLAPMRRFVLGVAAAAVLLAVAAVANGAGGDPRAGI